MKKLLTLTATAAFLAGLLVATASAAPPESGVIEKAEPAAQKQDAPAPKQDVQTPKPKPDGQSVQPAPKKTGMSVGERYEKRREVKKNGPPQSASK
jgi:hypothetical protein